MMTRRSTLWVWGSLGLSLGMGQCDAGYPNEFAPPDLSTGLAGGRDLATTGPQPDLLTIPAPTVVAVAPAVGPNTGSTPITLTGTGFLAGAAVAVAGTACSNVNVVSPTSITCTTAGQAATCGPVAIVVTNPDLQTATHGGFSYASKSFSLGAGKSIPNGAISRSAVWAEVNDDLVLTLLAGWP